MFVAAPLAAPLAAQEVTASATVGFANGTYLFAERYETWSLLGSLSLDWRRFSLSASLPVVAQNGTVLSRVGGITIPTGGPESGVVQRRVRNQPIAVRSGRRAGNAGPMAVHSPVSNPTFANVPSEPDLGPRTQASTDSLSVWGPGSMQVNLADPVFGGTLTVLESGDRRQRVALEGWAKAPIAAVSSGVSTGAWDYAAGISTSLHGGRMLLSSSATWWVLGDLPDLDLKNALFYSLSLGTSVGTGWGLSGGVSGATSIFDNAEPPVVVSVSLMRLLARRSLGVNVGVGLTETASDLSVGVSLSTSTRTP